VLFAEIGSIPPLPEAMDWAAKSAVVSLSTLSSELFELIDRYRLLPGQSEIWAANRVRHFGADTHPAVPSGATG
jgi:hypothetical protein